MNTSNVFEIQVQQNYTLLRFFGFVDASTVEQLKPALNAQLPKRCRNIIIDLKDVGFLDSHGIGLFVSLLKKAHRHHGKLIFAHVGGQPASVLDMVGLNNALVTYCDNVNDAYLFVEKEEKKLPTTRSNTGMGGN